jgi:hypothetical protein
MKILSELKKAIFAKYNLSTLWSTDAIPFYLNDAPLVKNYPLIVVKYQAGRNTMAMPSVAQPAGFNYVDCIFTFDIMGNQLQHVQMEDIADRLEDVYHRQTLITGNGVSFIAMFTTGSQTRFFDEGLKIWTVSLDFRVLAGC